MQILNIFFKMKGTKYKNTIGILTDGSHDENKTAAAMTVSFKDYTQPFRLLDHCSIMTAEF